MCFTPTYSSWANPTEANFGPPREFVLDNSNHPNHVVLTSRLHAYLREPLWSKHNCPTKLDDLAELPAAAQRLLDEVAGVR